MGLDLKPVFERLRGLLEVARSARGALNLSWRPELERQQAVRKLLLK